jgi:hypothetical protein
METTVIESAHTVEEPTVEEPTVEGPVVDEAVAAEPVATEPVVTEPVVEQSFELTDCGVGYLNELIQPYLTSIEGVTDGALLIDWVKQYLPGDADSLESQTAGMDADGIKQVITSTLMMKIACATQTHFSSGPLYTGTDKLMCTPWDILRDGTKDPEVAKLFFASVESTLPVTVTVDGTSHVHMITEEVATGLLLYCALSKYTISLSMCNMPFSEAFIEVLLNRALHDNETASYVMTLTDERKVHFSEGGFVQGFLTGVSWNKKDRKVYWKDIFSRTHNSMVTV